MPAPDTDPDEPRPALWERLQRAMLKPAADGVPSSSISSGDDAPTSVEELEAAVGTIDDKERLIGLFAAPLAGMVAVLTTASLIGNNPAARLADGAVNPKHGNPHVFLEFGIVAMVLAVAMLGFAWYRKRLFLGLTCALFGLSIFNLHFWGFGVPFLLVGSWYLVRAYRLNQKLKLATASDGQGPGPGPRGGPTRPNKRYTPPTAPPKPPATPPKRGGRRGGGDDTTG